MIYMKKHYPHRFADEWPPETGVKAHCEKHGDFELKAIKFMSRWMVWQFCPECHEEMISSRQGEREERENKQRHDKHVALTLSKGVGIRHAGKTFDDYRADTPGKQKALNAFKRFAGGVTNVIAVGGTGTGKTHLASAVIWERKHEDVLLIKFSELMRQQRQTYRNDSKITESQFLRKMAGIELLLIDEIGTKETSEAEKAFITEILDERYLNCVPTCLISNLQYNELRALLGGRTIDRFKEDGGGVIAFDWESERGKKQ